MAERTIELRFKVDDQGSLKLEAIKGNIGKVTTEVTNMDKALRIIKWDSIINLGERAYRTGKQIYDMTKNVAAFGDEIVRSARTLGMTTREYQEFGYMAMRSDVSTQSLTMGFRNLTKTMDEVARGTGEGADIFRILGMSVYDSEGKMKGLRTVMEEFAAKFSGWKEGPEKIAIALKIFGKSGEEIIPFLNQGAEGLEKFRKEFERLGIVISEKGLEALSKADEAFEKFEARFKTLKAVALTPVAEEVGRLIEKILKLIELFERIGKGENIPEAISKTIGNREAWLKARMELGWLKPEEFEELIKLQTKTIGGLPEKKLIPAPTIMPEKITYDKDAFKDWLEDWNKGITAMEALGVTAEAVQEGMARSAVENLGIVKEAWMEGKASGLDYANSLKATNDALNKLKPKDDLEDRLQVEKEYQKRLSEIMKMEASPERRDAAHELTDWWISELKRMDAVKPPSILDIPQLEADKDKSLTILKNLGMSIESNPIIQKIQIVQESKGESSFTGASPIKWASDVEANVNFTATGLSPKIPLGDAFTKIMSNFKTMGEKTSAMESTISFAEVNNELRSLQKQYDLYERVAQERMTLIRDFSSDWANPEQSEWMKQVRGLQADIASQMQIPKLKMAQQKYLMGFLGAEEEFYNLFKTQYSFQHGTDYVPKTGLALVHQGEKIIPANQNHIAMGGITFNINGAQNPRAVAEEIAQILEYKRNGRLEKAIQRVRS